MLRTFTAVVFFAGAGCQTSPPTVDVSGMVTFEDKPIASGQIRFVPVDGTEGRDVGARITDGSYRLEEQHRLRRDGKYRVEIRNSEKVNKEMPDSERPLIVRENTLPEIHNVDAKTIVTVTGEMQQLDFHLKATSKTTGDAKDGKGISDK